MHLRKTGKYHYEVFVEGVILLYGGPMHLNLPVRPVDVWHHSETCEIFLKAHSWAISQINLNIFGQMIDYVECEIKPSKLNVYRKITEECSAQS